MKFRVSSSKSIVRRASFALVATLLLLVALAWIVPLPERLLEPPSKVVRFSDGKVGFVFLSSDEKWRMRADLASIDADYVSALLAYEDRRFNYHPGVDPVALLRALGQNARAGEVVSGASTITMQLVRVLEPRSRSLYAKIAEALRSLQLELRMSKTDILAAYMTFISFGRNIEGVETAAWTYFGHGATNLTPSEIAILLAVPQLPAKRYPHPDHELVLRAARDKILRILYDRKLFRSDEVSLDASLQASVPLRLRPFPREAAHLAFWLDSQEKAQPDTNGNIKTTIDPAVQKLTTDLSSRESHTAANQGIHSHAVVVVDHSTSEIKAVIGGIDFWNRRAGSQIAGFQIPRSPGSLLKPFVYADAIDRGMVIPDRMVPDVPKDFGGYSPKNFDGNFSGLIRIEDALARSLNIPFVNLLEQVGIEKFLGLIGQTGVSRILKPPGYYGLSVAAGGIELSALEIVGLYAALARDGSFLPLRWLEKREMRAHSGLSILSPEAAWLTRKALRLRDRPDFPRRRDFVKVPAGVFWKTGTSFGHRDAWAAGSAGKYTAVVWFGNVDYAPSHALVGADMAAPLLFDILEGLVDPGRQAEDFKPPGIGKAEVCAFSGYIAGPACTHKREANTVVKNVPREVCPFHVQMEVDKATGLAVGPTCRESRTTERRTFVNWPSGVRRYLSSANRQLPELPSIHPACIHIAQDQPLRIVSPARNKTMILIPGMDPARQEVPLEVDSANASEIISWFLDGVFVGSARADTRLWWKPEPGRHEVIAVSADGRSVRSEFSVKKL